MNYFADYNYLKTGQRYSGKVIKTWRFLTADVLANDWQAGLFLNQKRLGKNIDILACCSTAAAEMQTKEGKRLSVR